MSQKPFEITLERGTTGLGFNIKGGTDAQVVPGDDSIYVAKIKPEGAAAKDDRLREGDKIIEINGFKLDKVTHQTAVSKFVNAGDVVSMVVKRAEETHTDEKKVNQNSSGLSTGIVISGTIVVGIAIAAAFVFMRSRQT